MRESCFFVPKREAGMGEELCDRCAEWVDLVDFSVCICVCDVYRDLGCFMTLHWVWLSLCSLTVKPVCIKYTWEASVNAKTAHWYLRISFKAIQSAFKSAGTERNRLCPYSIHKNTPVHLLNSGFLFYQTKISLIILLTHRQTSFECHKHKVKLTLVNLSALPTITNSGLFK